MFLHNPTSIFDSQMLVLNRRLLILDLLIIQALSINAFGQVSFDTVAIKDQPLNVARVTVKVDTSYSDTQRWKRTSRVTGVEKRPCDIDLTYPLFQLKGHPQANHELNAVVHAQIFDQRQPPEALIISQFCRENIVGCSAYFSLAILPEHSVIGLCVTTTSGSFNVPQTPVSKTWHYDFSKDEFLRFRHFFDSKKRKQLTALLRNQNEAFTKGIPINTDGFFIDQHKVTFYQDHRLLGAITVSRQALRAKGIWVFEENGQ